MPTAYILINYEIGAEQNIINKLKAVLGVIDASEVNGVYDIIIKITSDELRKIERYYNTTYKNNRDSQVN